MKKISAFLILLAGSLWGMMGIFVNETTKLGFSNLQTASIRVFVASVFMFVTVLLTDKSRLKIKFSDIYIFAILGIVCIFGMSAMYFYTIKNTSLSVAAILLYTSPIWVIIISAIFLKEKITWQKLLALFLAFIGCVFVSGVGSAKSISIALLFTGLGSGLTYGLYSIFGTVALRKYHPYTVTVYAFIFATVASFTVSDPVGIVNIVKNSENTFYTVFLMILTGFATAFLPFMLYTVGLKNTASGKAAIMASVEPLVATIIGFFVYGQSASLIGIIMIILAIVVVNTKTKKE